MKKEIKFSLVYRDMWQSSGKYQPRADQLVRIAPLIIEMGCFSRVETNGGAFEQVNQPNDLVLVQRQQNRLDILAPVGAEFIDLWYITNPTAPWRSWHRCLPPFFGIYRLYNVIRELSIRSERFTTLEFEGHSSVGVNGHCVNSGQPELFVKLGNGI